MKTFRVLLLLSILLGLGAQSGLGTIRYVPLDYLTIQEAINAALDADTVLVAPGVYPERINFLGKDIVVASHYIFSPDTSIVGNTVIDADSGGSAVTMINGETQAAMLIGFTVKNGTGTLYEPGYGTFYVGGGFFLIGASPLICNNIIRNNVTPDGGAGIFSDGGNPTIRNNIIIQNSSTSASGCGAGMLIKNSTGGTIYRNFVQFNHAKHGGGIALKHASPQVTRNVISNNFSTGYGGGIRIYDQSNPSIINNTISHNSALQNMGGGVEVENGSAPVFMNNIVSFTSAGSGFVVVGLSSPVLSYNLFHQNMAGNYLNVAPGVGDLTGDPAYIGGSPYNYHLTAFSAAIDHGNPDPLYNDPDNTRNDCGAFPFNQGSPTPVVLTNFSAAIASESVLLSWSTASEINCYGWIVQRSEDGNDFENVSPLIAGYGTSVEPHDYTFEDAGIQIGATYNYRLQQIDLSGAANTSNPITVVTGSALPLSITLQQNYPNPFNPETALVYDLPQASWMRLSIYDALGRLVAELVSGYQLAGQYTVTWRAEGLPSGTYLCRLDAGQQSFSRRLTLLR